MTGGQRRCAGRCRGTDVAGETGLAAGRERHGAAAVAGRSGGRNVGRGARSAGRSRAWGSCRHPDSTCGPEFMQSRRGRYCLFTSATSRLLPLGATPLSECYSHPPRSRPMPTAIAEVHATGAETSEAPPQRGGEQSRSVDGRVGDRVGWAHVAGGRASGAAARSRERARTAEGGRPTERSKMPALRGGRRPARGGAKGATGRRDEIARPGWRELEARSRGHRRAMAGCAAARPRDGGRAGLKVDSDSGKSPPRARRPPG
jgi:hypothetical protein